MGPQVVHGLFFPQIMLTSVWTKSPCVMHLTGLLPIHVYNCYASHKSSRDVCCRNASIAAICSGYKYKLSMYGFRYC